MQGTRVRALVWEDPTCRGATRPVGHNCWACASGASAPQQREAAIVRGPHTAMKSGPHLLQLEKALAQKRRPNIAINQSINQSIFRNKTKQNKNLMKRCSTSLIIRELQIKLQWSITSHQSEWPSSKSWQTINAGDGVGKKEPSYTVGGNVNWYSHYQKQYGGSLKN